MLINLVMQRDHLVILSWDPRWSKLQPKFLAKILDHDRLPVVNETELLSIVERWNSHRDKRPEDMLLVCQCFRQTGDNVGQLITFLSTLGIGNEVLLFVGVGMLSSTLIV